MFVLTSVTLSEGRDNKHQRTFQRSVSTESFAATQSLLSRLFVYMTVKSACWHLTKPLRTNIQL